MSIHVHTMGFYIMVFWHGNTRVSYLVLFHLEYIRVLPKVSLLEVRTASFGIIGHQTRNWEWKFYKVKWLKPKLVFPPNLVAFWVSSCLSFILSASLAATYIFTSTCTTIIITLETCALHAEFSTSHWDLIKFHYFVDTTERGDRGWKQAQKTGWLHW